MVAVEVRKKRTYTQDARGRMAEVKADLRDAMSLEATEGAASPFAAAGLTETEMAARARALEDARHRDGAPQPETPPEAEPGPEKDALAKAENDARRKTESEERHRDEEEARRLEVQAKAAAAVKELVGLIGSKEGCHHFALARVNPGDVVLMSDPGYPAYRASILMAEGEPVSIPILAEDGFLPRLEDIAADVCRRATAIYLVPTMMQRMWKLPDDIKYAYALSSLERAVHLAEPCPPWLKEVWIDWIGAEVLWELFGITEGHSVTMISGTEWLEHRGSVGRPVSGELKITDEVGNELPAGETGDVWMRAVGRDNPTYRYIGAEPEHRDGWECVGDVGWIDNEGYLYLADRRKDMILIGGANVYPAEVEAAIGAHPGVSSCVVIGLPDDDKGNVIHAIVEPAATPGVGAALTRESILAFLADRLVTYKLPRTFEFVTHSLRDDAGKVRRGALQAERRTNGT